MQVTDTVFKMLGVLLFCSSEEDFPEYCYSGEFSINQDDVDRFDPDAIFAIQKLGVKFMNAVGEDAIYANTKGEHSTNGIGKLVRVFGFMTLGGCAGYHRCPGKAKYIAIETTPGDDGLIGSMSICEDCRPVLEDQRQDVIITSL